MQPMLYPFARSGARVLCSLLLLAGLLICGRTMAATPPGTIIRSQAEASFVDEFNEQFMVTSNEVSTLIQEVTGVRLESEQHRWGMLGKELVFPHLLTNTGNISSSYTVTVASDPFVKKTTLHFDEDHDGLPDDSGSSELHVTLAPGADVSLLVKTLVPDVDYTDIDIEARVDECVTAATESGQGRCLAVNHNKMSRSRGVVYDVSMSANKLSTYVTDSKHQDSEIDQRHLVEKTFKFQRVDNKSEDGKERGKSFVQMDYLIPPELEYVKGSAFLYKYNASDDNLESEDRIKIHPDEKIPGVLRFNIHQTQQVGKPQYRPAKNDGHDGQLRFKVRAMDGVGETLYNAADYTFCFEDQLNKCPQVRQKTNYIPLYLKGYGISLNASSLSPEPHIGEPQIVASAPAGSVLQFTNFLWNLGTEPTSFKVTLDDGQNTNSLPFPSGSTYCLTKGAECTDFSETPEALTFNEGDISPGTHQAVRLFVQLPDAGISYQNSYNLTLKAVDTSTEHTYEVTDSTRNMLVKITGSATNSMDLTFGQSLNDNANAPGKGPGPEAEHLDIQEGKPGTTLKFNPIYINNTGSQADNYKLELEPDSDGELPKSFKWFFVNEFDQPIANSGTVPANGNTRVQVWIELPPDHPSQSWSFNVRARSAVTGATDSLHLRLTVEAEEQILLAPNGQSQVSPGSFVTFVHQLTNAGNMPEDTISLTVQDSLTAQGWQSLVYLDSNGDGQISAGESPLQEQPIALAADKTVTVLVKVFAPANAAQGSVNITTLTAVFGANDGQSVSVIDTATANNAIVGITKTQAFWNCKNAPPEPVSSQTFPVKPGECVVYKLVATNHGREAVQNVVIYDKAPDFTVFIEKTGDLPKVDHNGQHHISGQIINATWSQGLMPGQSVFLKFGIKVQ